MQRTWLVGVIGLLVGYLVGAVLLPIRSADHAAAIEAHNEAVEKNRLLRSAVENLKRRAELAEELADARKQQIAEINAALGIKPRE